MFDISCAVGYICLVHSPKASHIYDSIISIIIWEVINQCMCIDRLNRLNFDFFNKDFTAQLNL